MYKLLLCWRYLRTRYIALASVISVTLGVATMIVVNSVMEGFTHEMQSRIHGILSDVVFASRTLEGFRDPQAHMDRIREVAGDYIAGMTPTVAIPAMMFFEVQGHSTTQQVTVIGIDEATHAQVSDFARFLQHPENRKQLSFDLRDDGYDEIDHQGDEKSKPRERMQIAGRKGIRKIKARFQKDMQPQWPPTNATPAVRNPQDSARGDVDDRYPSEPDANLADANSSTANNSETDRASGQQTAEPPEQLEYEGYKYQRGEVITRDESAAEQPAADNAGPASNPFKKAGNPFKQQADEQSTDGAIEKPFDPEIDTYDGIVLGIALASYRGRDGSDRFLLLPGEDIKLTIPTAGTPPKAVSDNFTVVDFYESKMSEYDSNFVFVPIRKLQDMRNMIDPQTGLGNATSIQIKLHNDADGPIVRDLLQRAFPLELYDVQTWRDKQGPLLAAVTMETAILNLLLFLIIAVAGFGILAIFYMIVVEKTRDIGILKSLGAHSGGIMGIFLGYGLSLGIVGSGAGMVLGLLFVANINGIATILSGITGHEVFDPSIYYFQEIPTIVVPFTVAWIVAGAMLIAVFASILPARRAARLHPVEALRYE